MHTKSIINTQNTFRGGLTIKQKLALWLANYDFWKSLLAGHCKMCHTLISQNKTRSLLAEIFMILRWSIHMVMDAGLKLKFLFSKFKRICMLSKDTIFKCYVIFKYGVPVKKGKSIFKNLDQSFRSTLTHQYCKTEKLINLKLTYLTSNRPEKLTGWLDQRFYT